ARPRISLIVSTRAQYGAALRARSHRALPELAFRSTAIRAVRSPLMLIASALDTPWVAATVGAYAGAVLVAVMARSDRGKANAEQAREFLWGTVFMIGPVIAVLVGVATMLLTGGF